MEYLTYCILVSIDKQMETAATFNSYKNDINNFLSNTIIEFTQPDVHNLTSISDLRAKIRERRAALQIALGTRAITKDATIRIWKLRISAYLSRPENEAAARLMTLAW
jgi:hypothetical protein